MKVSELIERLKDFDDDMDVMLRIVPRCCGWKLVSVAKGTDAVSAGEVMLPSAWA